MRSRQQASVPTAYQKPYRLEDKHRTDTIDRLRDCIRRIESRTPELDGDSELQAEASPPTRLHLITREVIPEDNREDAQKVPREDDGLSPSLPRLTPPSSSHPISSGTPLRWPQTTNVKATRARIDRIIQTQPAPDRSLAASPISPCSPPWTLGETDCDILTGPGGLDLRGVHEIKPAEAGPITNPATNQGSDTAADWASAWGAARTFVLSLLARRLKTLEATHDDSRSILWCQPRQSANDLGHLYAPGLATFGLSSSRLKRLIIVEPARPQEALWTLEEALRSQSLALVIGVADHIGLTPARRLALAAQAHATPCLLLTNPHTPAMAATASHWRAGPIFSPPASNQPASNPTQAVRLSLSLERLRARPETVHAFATRTRTYVEWCHETLRFRLVPPLPHRAHEQGEPWQNSA